MRNAGQSDQFAVSAIGCGVDKFYVSVFFKWLFIPSRIQSAIMIWNARRWPGVVVLQTRYHDDQPHNPFVGAHFLAVPMSCGSQFCDAG
jgi:hypothetical protein